MIHVVGANPGGGGVLTYVKNLTYSLNDLRIYDYTDYFGFFCNVQDGDTVFLNVVKPSLPFLMLSKLKFLKKINITYCGHGLNYKNHKGIKRSVVRFCEYLISKFSDKIVVLNKNDMGKFLSWNKSSFYIPTSLILKDYVSVNDSTVDKNISWIAVGCVEERKNPSLFIEIGRAVKSIFPNDSFTWVGDGPLLEDFDVESLEKEGIFFKGPMDNDSVRKKLSAHQIFLCTSSWEVLPISILEAVEAGCIICTKNYYYSDDVISRFSSSVHFENIDQVLEIRKDRDILRHLKTAAIHETSNLSESYDSYINSMKEVLYE
jgi:glycosyltransferase involved in cell wall biosynthesis